MQETTYPTWTIQCAYANTEAYIDKHKVIQELLAECDREFSTVGTATITGGVCAYNGSMATIESCLTIYLSFNPNKTKREIACNYAKTFLDHLASTFDQYVVLGYRNECVIEIGKKPIPPGMVRV